METIRVLIADDHTLVRAGIRALLQGLEGVEVVAEAGDGREAMALALVHRPDVLVTDIAMPHVSGLELAARVARELPEARVIILSMHGNEEYASRALAGRRGGLPPEGLGTRRVGACGPSRGAGRDLPQPGRLQARHRRLPPAHGRGAAESGSLTPRQRQVLRLIAEGKTTKAIAGSSG